MDADAETTEFVFDQFEYKGELPETLNEGDVFSVRMVEEANDVKDVPLFIREHLVEQESKFQRFFAGKKFSPSKVNKRRRHLYVTGPPGCGKTAFTTLVAHRYAAQTKRVLMILFREQTECHVFIIDGQETRKLQKKLLRTDVMPIVRKLLEARESIPHFDLCILDGIRQSLKECTLLMQLLRTYTGETGRIRLAVYTTSSQFQLRAGDMPLGSNRSHEEMKFDSFSLDDYKKAIANKTFLKRLLTSQPDIMDDILHWKREGKPRLQLVEEEENDEDTNDISVDTFTGDRESLSATLDYVNHNYYYAGGSARYMFEYTTVGVKDLFGDLFDQIKADEWDAFASATLSAKAPNAVNSLMQQFGGYATPVSRCVLFEAYDKVAGRLVDAVEAAANNSGNPALRGWAFELKQLHTIKTVLEGNSVDNNNPGKMLKSKEGLCFRPVKSGEAKFDGNELKSQVVELNSGTVIWCMKWNQGCYDVAFLKENTLLTLQFTISGVHSLKLQYIKALKDAIENSGVKVDSFVHVGVVGGDDDGRFKEFTFQDPEGTGRSTWVLDFTVKTYKASELVAISGEEQECLEATPLGDKEVYTQKRAVGGDNP